MLKLCLNTYAITMMLCLLTPLILLLLLLSSVPIQANDNLRVAYEWKAIDFKYASAEKRWMAIENFEFKPSNVIPFGIEVYRTRLFVTLPRWRSGVPASLAYLDLNANSTKSPVLVPYPSWVAHSMNELEPELVSPFRVRADRCGRLWVLDSRIDGVLLDTKVYGPAQLLVYDLHNDNLLRRHTFPLKQVKENSFFANIAVEDGECENTYAYAGDLGSPGLVVYSWRRDESWRIHHNYFHPDPLAGNYSIGTVEFQWDDGLYGLALSKAQSDGYATLYFHPLSSTMEFAVNTMILRNKTLATSGKIYREFKILGSRGPNAQAGASFLDQLTGVLFYALPNLNAVACWKTSNRAYTIKSQGRVYMSPVEMVFPSDVKVDDQDRLWVLSNRLQDFIYGELFPTSVNFRILTAHVKDAIENTACDIKTKPLPEIINKLGDILNTVTSPTGKTGSNSQGFVINTNWSLILAVLLFVCFSPT
ncbi:protein yellow [Glossina fuscipes]|uniref:Protein yellow n=1 Tax=Glossina fuscipes TaxID=7396 RepID=A0A8U0WCD8_9MUSC|nr:protein yellow [Glossina fuscipes]XP_037882623.1 protein yellow [Glossina fuscipes]XP_037882624.1 protein yellow [Glossina fuscipes]XP_037882625.1 protein yellow [Glossina fuscipes]XP_037882626.1 protein yellow [Glossina fuscipes]